MIRALRNVGLVLVCVAIAAGAVRAQEPKVGSANYEDKSDLGFKVKVPQGWDLIPPTPDDVNTIAKYVPHGLKSVEVGGKQLDVMAFVIKFDHRKKDDGSAEKPKAGVQRVFHNCKDIQEWVKANLNGLVGMHVESQKDLVVNKTNATQFDFSTQGDPKAVIHFYAMVYKFKPDCEVAFGMLGPGDKRWTKWAGPVEQLAKSFTSVEVKEVEAAPVGETLRDRTRAECQKKLATLGKDIWKLYESPHYFIITSDTDKKFLDELKTRLEAIHEVYEQDYPAAKAEEYRKVGEATKTGDAKSDAEKAQDKALKDFMTGGADPKDLASCSVVHVFTDHDAYMSYGAPGGSAGYWDPMNKELVLYHDRVEGPMGTWRVLNHEAFHQYIFYFYGGLAPHYWYNEGTGDYYSGYQLVGPHFVLGKFLWRTDEIRTAIQTKAAVPLKDFVRFDRAKYYDPQTIGQNYAQGWSFVYFLRTGKKNNAKGWDNRWDSILETYLRVLATSGKLDQAVDEAFKDVDFDALEKSWADYTLK